MFDEDNKKSHKDSSLIPKAIMTMEPYLGVQCIMSRIRGEKEYYETVSTACHAMAAMTYRKQVEALEIMLDECFYREEPLETKYKLLNKLEILLNEAEAKGYLV